MCTARRLRLLLAAAGLGLALAGAVAPATRAPGVPEAEAVAEVNGVLLSRLALQRAITRAGGSADPAQREALLQALVDEELLVQRAREVGLVESDRSIRKALARAAIDHAVDEASARPPDEAELRAFHAAHPALFAAPRQLRVRAIRFSGASDADAPEDRAQEAAEALARGSSFDEVAARWGDRPGPPLPDALLPEPALRRALGPTLADAAAALPAGAISAPLRAGGVHYLLQVAEIQPGPVRRFEAVRDEVAAESMRQRSESALGALLARLRSQARIERATDAPRP